MNFKLSLLVTGFCIFNMWAEAEQVNVQTAQVVALNFFKLNGPAASQGKNNTIELKYTRAEQNNSVDFYVFDINSSGFVIVSGDDNLEPVIAYSTESVFHSDANHVGVIDWMNHASEKITAALRQQVKADERIAHLWTSYVSGINPGLKKSTPVGPLLTTTWNQEPYYNQRCPYNSNDKLNCLTGCVATTMAQIMKFWNYPPSGTGSYSYNDTTPKFENNYGIQSADFGATVYNWQQMPSYITSNNPDIATLMYQCGVSVAMSYGDDKQGGSGAAVLQQEAGYDSPSAQSAYKTYFSYNGDSLKGLFASNFAPSAWTNLLEGELNAGRPIQYEGRDPTKGGHTWVCDGYDANDMFHMNWGWGGYDNGYYSLSNLSAASADFSSEEAALIGIMPGTVKSPVPTGENILTASSFKLYPNPASQYITIEYGAVENGLMHLNIYNLAGQRMFNEEFSTADGLNTRSININNLDPGVYILENIASSAFYRQKFIITK
jgi:hypothetical protein